MEYVDRLTTNVYDTFADIDVKHGIRLVVIVGGYWFFRQAMQRFLAKRQLEQQVQADRAEKAEEKLNDLVDNPDAAEASSTGTEAKWGWGKKTRKQVKRQEKIIQETLENLHSATPDDDRDIADLLED